MFDENTSDLFKASVDPIAHDFYELQENLLVSGEDLVSPLLDRVGIHYDIFGLVKEG